MKLKIKIPKDDTRNVEQIHEHYTLEKELATQLRSASLTERQHLYTALYDQLFQSIPHHPQFHRKADGSASQVEVARKLKLVQPYLKTDTIFLEVGPGDCQFAFAVAQQVSKVYAVDVSTEITQSAQLPDNFELIISNGCNVPVAENSVTVAYSNQLMEHLHPEDANLQLKDLYRCLQPGGVYICITPNRLAGPHDVSKYFDAIATGFHLQEYTNRELNHLLLSVGFSKVMTYMGGKGYYMRVPKYITLAFEFLLSKVPFSIRYQVNNFPIFRAALGVILVAQK